MRIYLAGGLRIESGEAVVDHRVFDSPHAQLVLAYLVCERGRPIARAEVRDLLTQVDASRTTVAHPLDGLGDLVTTAVPASQWRASDDAIELVLPRDVWVDVEAAADAIHEAESAIRAGHPADAFGPSAIAHHIARRPFLPGEHGTWVDGHRARLRGILVRALEARGEVFLANRETSLAIEAAREVVALEPYREVGHRLLIRAFAESGNAAEAARAYERCRLSLRERFGMEPSPPTQRLLETLAGASVSSPPTRAVGRNDAGSPSETTLSSHDLTRLIRQALSGHYTIERELSGGMSRVWVATERSLDRRVVIKVLPPNVSELVTADRFAREVRLVARLQHPNIVPILSVGVLAEALSLPYFTMPYVSGESLRAALSTTAPMPLARVIPILRDVARALAFAHREGVIHRDIKPENILLSADAAVVTDFGIAKAIVAGDTETTMATGQRLTGLGQSLGTPEYMAPEQCLADPAMDRRADIYSFGVVAYEVLTGSRPFATTNPHQNVVARLTQRPADVRSLRADTPDGLGAVVMQCLERQAADRPQRMTEVVDRLESSASGHSRVRTFLASVRLRLHKA